MTHWLAIGGGIVLVVCLFVLRRRLLDNAGPGRLRGVGTRRSWDGRPRRASDPTAPRGD